MEWLKKFLKKFFNNEALFHACKNGDSNIVSVLLSRDDININAKFVLYLFIFFNNISICCFLITFLFLVLL